MVDATLPQSANADSPLSEGAKGFAVCYAIAAFPQGTPLWEFCIQVEFSCSYADFVDRCL